MAGPFRSAHLAARNKALKIINTEHDIIDAEGKLHPATGAKPATKWQRLRKRIKDELGIELEEKFTRLYPGHWQRSRGAWSWQAGRSGGAHLPVGSQWSMTELLKAEKLTKYIYGADTEIIPERADTE